MNKTVRVAITTAAIAAFGGCTTLYLHDLRSDDPAVVDEAIQKIKNLRRSYGVLRDVWQDSSYSDIVRTKAILAAGDSEVAGVFFWDSENRGGVAVALLKNLDDDTIMRLLVNQDLLSDFRQKLEDRPFKKENVQSWRQALIRAIKDEDLRVKFCRKYAFAPCEGIHKGEGFYLHYSCLKYLKDANLKLELTKTEARTVCNISVLSEKGRLSTLYKDYARENHSFVSCLPALMLDGELGDLQYDVLLSDVLMGNVHNVQSFTEALKREMKSRGLEPAAQIKFYSDVIYRIADALPKGIYDQRMDLLVSPMFDRDNVASAEVADKLTEFVLECLFSRAAYRERIGELAFMKLPDDVRSKIMSEPIEDALDGAGIRFDRCSLSLRKWYLKNAPIIPASIMSRVLKGKFDLEKDVLAKMILIVDSCSDTKEKELLALMLTEFWEQEKHRSELSGMNEDAVKAYGRIAEMAKKVVERRMAEKKAAEELAKANRLAMEKRLAELRAKQEAEKAEKAKMEAERVAKAEAERREMFLREMNQLRNKAGMGGMSPTNTIATFCGVAFGEEIALRFPSAKLVDNSKSRQYSYSYMQADLTLGNPFRNFKDGKVYASMTTKRIYKIELKYSFPRDATTAVDDAEYEGTLMALKRKYGESNVAKTGMLGDKTNVFKLGDVLVTLEYTTEGVLDCGGLKLTAENIVMKKIAEDECKAFYQQRSRQDVENMKGFENGGIDAL